MYLDSRENVCLIIFSLIDFLFAIRQFILQQNYLNVRMTSWVFVSESFCMILDKSFSLMGHGEGVRPGDNLHSILIKFCINEIAWAVSAV